MTIFAKRFARYYLRNYLIIIMVMVSAITMIYIPCLFRSSVEYGESEYIRQVTHDCDIMLTGDTDTIKEILLHIEDSDKISFSSDSHNVYVKILNRIKSDSIAHEISYICNQADNDIDVILYSDFNPIDPRLSMTLLAVRIIFTSFGSICRNDSFPPFQ